MKYEVDNKKVQEILDELGEEYKDLLVKKALQQHGEYDISRINLSTIVKLDEHAKEILYTDELKRKRNNYLLVLTVAGLIYTFIGLVLLMYYEFGESLRLSPIILLAYLCVVIGLLATLLSITIRNLPYSTRFKNRNSSDTFNYDIVNTWKQLEGLLVQLTPAEDDMTLNGMISYLAELKLLTNDDVFTVKELLNLRNQIVHSNTVKKQYKNSEIQTLLGNSSKIVKKLQKFENS